MIKTNMVMQYLKSTKGTHVFREDNLNITFYLPKHLVGGETPDEIEVIIFPVNYEKDVPTKPEG
jgi:hypothetical protein